MNWQIAGWLFILLSALLLLSFRWVIRIKRYSLRELPFSQKLARARTAAIEQGRHQDIFLGNKLWHHRLPGLAFSGLTVLQSLLDPDHLASGHLTISASSAILAVFARQITSSAYKEGFSAQLLKQPIDVTAYGLTPVSYAVGFMAARRQPPAGTLLLLGDYDEESGLLVAAMDAKRGQLFAAAGSFSALSVMYPLAENLLIGEEAYLLPAFLDRQPKASSLLLVEDILRGLVIALLIVGAALKVAGLW